jgi:hypothetical protein
VEPKTPTVYVEQEMDSAARASAIQGASPWQQTIAILIVGLLALLVGVLGLVVGREMGKQGQSFDGASGNEGAEEEGT